MIGSRLPIQIRSALAAALAAALVFTAGALWLRHELYAAQMTDAVHQARSDLYTAATGFTGSRPSDVPPFGGPSSIAVFVDPQGHFIEGLPGMEAFVPDPLGPLPPGTPVGTVSEKTVTLGAAAGSADPEFQRLAHRTVTVVTSSFDTTMLSGRPSPVRLTLHIVVTPWDAERAVAAVDQVLYFAVPGAVLLVALIVWTTTTRALRPVEAIQRRLRAITARDLSLRVPVPPGRDAIARLATTANDTLNRLEASVEQQRRFVADASHELRTPLAALRADLDVALHYPDQTNWPQVARDTLGDTEHLQQLTDDLLLLATLDNHTPRPAHPVALGPLARDAATRAARHAAPIQIDCHCEADVTVQGDPGQLERLLRNLLDNAVRHARSRVTVAVASRTATAVLEVGDDGPGVPHEHRERIFKRFARLDASRDRGAGGTGLGLAIAREIATRHGGTLHLADTAPAAGARFIAEIPLCNPLRGLAGHEPIRSRGAGGEATADSSDGGGFI